MLKYINIKRFNINNINEKLYNFKNKKDFENEFDFDKGIKLG